MQNRSLVELRKEFVDKDNPDHKLFVLRVARAMNPKYSCAVLEDTGSQRNSLLLIKGIISRLMPEGSPYIDPATVKQAFFPWT